MIVITRVVGRLLDPDIDQEIALDKIREVTYE